MSESNTVDDVADSHGTEAEIDGETLAKLTDRIVARIKSVYDPEIPVDIFELGLIYKVDVTRDTEETDRFRVEVDMTLTAPGCPVAGEMPGWVQDAILNLPEVALVKVNMVFDPPWDPSRMSDEAKLELNMF